MFITSLEKSFDFSEDFFVFYLKNEGEINYVSKFSTSL
ncbi:hypothetical protein UAY_02376 [Enterococcus moraviensis ATCC BAA-383]|uniref:Uncharacterized protein n=1 Tax=Enterococcus moraviensis ATCC BAA-383 TaxID=1158609 RepID=R2TDZ1_9ENTE|nr:hypothetical protein UAY_02376 [Enterococcus moraviensis ATCC BAA-383]EOT71718.1 hypothetical protein I586_01525 [Enterococcus moraviensis ATCC BAA-383]